MSIPKRIRPLVPKLVPIGPAVWQLPRLFNVWPPKTPWFILGANYIWPVSIPRRIRRFIPNSVPIGPADWQHPQTMTPWMCDPLTPPPPKCPWGIVEPMVFSLCPFSNESADVYQLWCQSVQPFDSFPRLLNLWPPTPTPNCLLGYWGATWI